MNGRQLTDAQISSALRARLPVRAQAGLRERVLDSAERTSQQRALPSFLGALTEADPFTRRRSLLIAAALLIALALASAAAVGALRLLRDQSQRFRLSIGKRERTQVAHRQSHRHRRRDRLNRPAILKSEAGSQYLVSANDVIDGLLEQPCLKRALHPDGDGDVVKGGVRLQLFEEPKPLLS